MPGTPQRAYHLRPRGKAPRMERAATVLLDQLPSAILSSYPVTKWGLAEGMSIAAGQWRQAMADGLLREPDMRASIIPLAVLLSAAVEALLRGVPIDQRTAAFERLVCDSNGILSGRPNAVILQCGIL